MSAVAFRLVGVVAATVLIAGCGLARVEQPTEDTLATWSDHPLPPDAALAASAASEMTSCKGDPDAGRVRVLLQDRRTQQSAAFLVADQNSFGSCFVSSGAGVTSGSRGPLPGPMSAALVIDENSEGEVGAGKVRLLGGRAANGAAQVIVELADGRSVVASIGNGFWLAWWPDTSLARRVVANDATGAEIASAEVAG